MTWDSSTILWDDPTVTWDGFSISLGLTATVDTGFVTLTWNDVGGPYDVYRDGVRLGTTDTLMWIDEPQPQNKSFFYTVEAGVSQTIQVFVPYASNLIGNPKVRLHIEDQYIPCEQILEEIRIIAGPRTWTPTPTPNSMSAILKNKLDVEAGQLVQLFVNENIRFYGRITDFEVDWNGPTTRITALGPLEHLGWSDMPETTTTSTAYNRMSSIMSTVYADMGYMLPGSNFLDVVLKESPKQTARDAVEDVCVSTSSRLVEQHTGIMEWVPQSRRFYRPTYTIDQCYLLKSSNWAQESEDLANDVKVNYGDNLSVQATVAVGTPFQRRSVQVQTILQNVDDAQALADQIVTRRSVRHWRYPEIAIPLHKTPSHIGYPLLEMQICDRLKVEWDGGPVDVDGHIEGYEEFITPTTWAIAYNVSDVALTGADQYPLNLRVTVDTTSATLNWNFSPYATEYRVYRNNVLQSTTTGLSFTDTGLSLDTSYTWRVEAWYLELSFPDLFINDDEVTAKTLAIDVPATPSITMIKAYNGVIRTTLAHSGTWLASLRVVIKQGSYPANVNDGTTYNVAPGTHNFTGPGTGSRPEQTWYMRVWAVNSLGQYSNYTEAAQYFLPNPLVYYPTVRNAYGTTYGWENQSRVRHGNTSSNVYRGIWCYNNPAYPGLVVTSAAILLYRKDGGPTGAMAVNLGTHNYTSQPGGRPTVDNLGFRGSIPRMSSQWVDISGFGSAFVNHSVRGFGIAYDAVSATYTYVGQPVSDDGVVHVAHADFGP